MSNTTSTTREEAEAAADRHRAQFGDDVIHHWCEDYGDMLFCEDCDWAMSVDDFDSFCEECQGVQR